MQIIKKLSKMIEEELNDAEKYAKCALNYKDDRPMLAETFYSLSIEELKHMNQLHNSVVRIIEEIKQTGQMVPPGMMELYDYLHEGQIEHEKEVRMLQTMFRE